MSGLSVHSKWDDINIFKVSHLENTVYGCANLTYEHGGHLLEVRADLLVGPKLGGVIHETRQSRGLTERDILERQYLCCRTEHMQVAQKDHLDFLGIIAAAADTSIGLQKIQIPEYEYDIDQTQFYFG